MSTTESTEPMYRRDGEWLVPTQLARGPWFEDSQHGGAIAALLVRCAEQAPTAQPMRFTRMSVELFRTVPLRPVRTVYEVVRDGKRIQSVDVRMYVQGDERLFARASFGRIRIHDALLAGEVLSLREPPVPHRGEPALLDYLAKPSTNTHRFAYATNFETFGMDINADTDNFVWWKLKTAVVEDERNSDAVRLAAIADMASSAGRVLSHDRYQSPNSDLSILVAYEPRGQWVCMSSAIRIAEDGIGQTDALLWDDQGVIGRAVKSLLIAEL